MTLLEELARIERDEEVDRKLEAFDVMLDALQYAYDRLGIADVEAWERIARAIRKAKGEA